MLVAMPPAYATRFRNEISGAMQAAWHEQHRVAAASLRALAKNARTGHPVFETGGKTTRKAGHAPLSKMGQPVEATDWLLNGYYGNHRSLILSAGPRSELVSCVSLRAVDAGVLLEVLLRNPVEGHCGNRTLQARSCHTPGAVGAAPAAEVVAVDPDQVFVHGICLCVSGLELGQGAGIKRASPHHHVISHGIRKRPSTKGASLQP